MSSSFYIHRICQNCGVEFVARTTVTKYCGDQCAKRAYKVRKRKIKIAESDRETKIAKANKIEALKAKKYLTVPEVAQVLNISLRTTYRFIAQGRIKAANPSIRKTIVKTSDLDDALINF